MTDRSLTKQQKTISLSCRSGSHEWCANRSPEESHCGCECHEKAISSNERLHNEVLEQWIGNFDSQRDHPIRRLLLELRERRSADETSPDDLTIVRAARAYVRQWKVDPNSDMLDVWSDLFNAVERSPVETSAPFGVCSKCQQPITSVHNISGCPAEKASVPRCPWCGGQHIGTDCKAEKANAEVRTDAGVSPASHAEEVPLAEGSVLNGRTDE